MTKSILFGLILFSSTLLAAEPFSLEPYLKSCGGKIYAKCNAAELNQQTIFADALKVGIESNRELMVVFGADWCPACASFAKMLATDPARSRLHDKYVVVEINGDVSSGREVSKELGMARTAYPQAFIIATKSKTVTKQFFPTMFLSLEDLLANLDGSNLPKTVAKITALGDVKLTTLELPIGLVDDYGTSNFFSPVTREGEALVNQGIAALHVYQYVDAYRSFRSAELKNPDLVMAIVGQIMATLEISGGFGSESLTNEAMARIESIAARRSLTNSEGAWVNYARALLAGRAKITVFASGNTAMSLSMARQQVLSADPANLDAATLITWSAMTEEGVAEGKKTFRSVLAKNPNHVGAVHSLLHIAEFENDNASARALGAQLARLVPGSAHAVHMYGHTLPQQGLWKEASAAFEKANSIHNRWAERYGLERNQDWHYSHNLDLLAASYLAQGQFDLAATTWKGAGSDYRAVRHYLELLLVTKSKAEFTAELDNYEKSGWPMPALRYELNLDLSAAVPGDSDDDHDSGDTYADLLKAVVETAKAGAQTASPALSERVTAYFAKRFKAGGFDGWSNAYLEMLRLKRVAQLLSVKNLSEALVPLEFAARSGSLCGTGSQPKSLVRCMP